MEKHEEEKKLLETYRDFVFELIPKLAQKEEPVDVDDQFFLTQQKEPAQVKKTPAALLDQINHYESRNLFLITQTQEAEQDKEKVRQTNGEELKALRKREKEMQGKLNVLKNTRGGLNVKLDTMHKIDQGEDLLSPTSMGQIKKQLEEIYRTLAHDESGTTPGIISMVRETEIAMENLLKKRDCMDEGTVNRHEKSQAAEYRKETQARNDLEFQRRQAETRRKIDERKNRVIKKNAKKVMVRSEPPKKKIKEKVIEIDQEVINRIEFLEMDLDPITGEKNS